MNNWKLSRDLRIAGTTGVRLRLEYLYSVTVKSPVVVVDWVNQKRTDSGTSEGQIISVVCPSFLFNFIALQHHLALVK